MNAQSIYMHPALLKNATPGLSSQVRTTKINFRRAADTTNAIQELHVRVKSCYHVLFKNSP